MKSLLQIILFASVVTLGSVSWGAKATLEECERWKEQSNNPNDAVNSVANKEFYLPENDCAKRLLSEKRAEKLDDKKSASCEKRRNAYEDAVKDFTKACSNIGGTGCDVASVKDCSDGSGSELREGLTQMGSSLGLPNPLPNSCSEMTGQDYTATKKDIEDDIQRINKEISDAQRDLTNEKKELTQKNKELQQEMTRNQEAFEQLKLDIAASKRDKIQKQMEEQEKLRKATEEIQEAIFKERDAMTTELESLNIQLMQMSDAALESSCMREQVNPLVDRFKAEIAGNPNAAGRDSQKRREELNRVFDECMAGTRKARDAKSAAFKRQQEGRNRNIDRLTAQLDSNQRQLQALMSNSQQDVSAEDQKQTNAYNKFARDLQVAQQNLYELQNQLAERERSSNELIMKLRMQVFTKQNELASLGPMPKGGAKGKGTFGEVVTALQEKDSKRSSYRKMCCAKGGKLDEIDESLQDKTKAAKTSAKKSKFSGKNIDGMEDDLCGAEETKTSKGRGSSSRGQE